MSQINNKPKYNNFRLHKAGLNPVPFLAEVDRLDDPWSITTGRQEKIKVQREAKSLAIRGIRKSAIGERNRRDVHESRFTTIAKKLPSAVSFLQDFALEYGGVLSRAKIVCLPSGHRVYPHIDQGEYYAHRDRFHLVLQAQSGSWLKTGEELVEMQVGELWWFNNKLTHEAHNGGSEDRIHLIFDLMRNPENV